MAMTSGNTQTDTAYNVLLSGNRSSRPVQLMQRHDTITYPLQAGTASGYCGKPSSSVTQCIFSLTQMCSVGLNALRSSKTASATPAAVPLRRQENNRVPQALQKTRSSTSEEG